MENLECPAKFRTSQWNSGVCPRTEKSFLYFCGCDAFLVFSASIVIQGVIIRVLSGLI